LPSDPDIRGPPDEQTLVRFTLMSLQFRYHWEKTRRHQSTPPIPDPHDGLIHGGDDDDEDAARATAMADEVEEVATTSVHQDLEYLYMPGRVVAPTSKRSLGTNGRVATPTGSASRPRQPATGGSFAGSSVSSSQGSSSSHAGSAFMTADDDDDIGDDIVIYQSGGGRQRQQRPAAAAMYEDDEFSRGMSAAAKRRFGTYVLYLSMSLYIHIILNFYMYTCRYRSTRNKREKEECSLTETR